jgi:hypothetical protein
MVCRNICKQMDAGRASYISGTKYCTMCEIYLYQQGIFCICCRRKLRTRPANKKGRERLRMSQEKF